MGQPGESFSLGLTRWIFSSGKNPEPETGRQLPPDESHSMGVVDMNKRELGDAQASPGIVGRQARQTQSRLVIRAGS